MSSTRAAWKPRWAKISTPASSSLRIVRRPRARSSRPWAGVPSWTPVVCVRPSPVAPRRPELLVRRGAAGRLRLAFLDRGILLRLGVPDTRVTFRRAAGYAPEPLETAAPRRRGGDELRDRARVRGPVRRRRSAAARCGEHLAHAFRALCRRLGRLQPHAPRRHGCDLDREPV